MSSQNDNLHIFRHLQALCSVTKANNLSITAQSTNCENHMADQDHVTHTAGYRGARANKLLFDTPPSYGCKIERFLINIVHFKNYQPAVKQL